MYLKEVADCFNVAAIILLLGNIIYTRSCKGLSGRSQLLLSTVYLTRYADMWFDFIFSVQVLLQLIFIDGTIITVFLIMVVFREKYERVKDTYATELLLVPSFVLASILSKDRSVVGILWTFSIFLEAMAILPQLSMMLSSEKIDRVLMLYFALIGIYRTLYISWGIDWYIHGGYDDSLSTYAGLVHISVAILVVIQIGMTIIHNQKNVGVRTKNDEKESDIDKF